jgi:thioredoxin-related protein
MSTVASQTMPSFKIMLSDNKIFNADELPKNKPVLLIYFDPECDHCQKLMTELFKRINEFKKAEIVLVTFKQIGELSPFEKKFDISKYPNIKVGTEGSGFYLRNYFGLEKMPFVALYDKKGNLSYSNKEQTAVDEIVKQLKKLK